MTLAHLAAIYALNRLAMLRARRALAIIKPFTRGSKADH